MSLVNAIVHGSMDYQRSPELAGRYGIKRTPGFTAPAGRDAPAWRWRIYNRGGCLYYGTMYRPWLTMTLLWLVTMATPAVAEQVQPENLEQTSVPRWIVIVLILLLIGFVCLASFKDSKRSNQGS